MKVTAQIGPEKMTLETVSSFWKKNIIKGIFFHLLGIFGNGLPFSILNNWFEDRIRLHHSPGLRASLIKATSLFLAISNNLLR